MFYFFLFQPKILSGLQKSYLERHKDEKNEESSKLLQVWGNIVTSSYTNPVVRRF